MFDNFVENILKTSFSYTVIWFVALYSTAFRQTVVGMHGTMYRIIILVRHKKARFDNKMDGSTQKGPVRHKNARTQKCLTQHALVDIDIIEHTPLFYWNYFLTLIRCFVLKNTYINLLKIPLSKRCSSGPPCGQCSQCTQQEHGYSN